MNAHASFSPALARTAWAALWVLFQRPPYATPPPSRPSDLARTRAACVQLRNMEKMLDGMGDFSGGAAGAPKATEVDLGDAEMRESSEIDDDVGDEDKMEL